jgi:hypothetical protein
MHRKRTVKRHHKHHSRKNKGMVKRTLKKGYNVVNSTSKKYMPVVKTGLEGVGSKVTKTAKNAVPILQKTTRDLFGIVGIKKKSATKRVHFH